MLKFEVFVSGVQAGLLPSPLPFTNGVASRQNFISGGFLQELISMPPHRCLWLIFMNLELCIKFLIPQNQSMIKTRFI